MLRKHPPLVCALFIALAGFLLAQPLPRASNPQLQSIREYIKSGWHALTRTNAHLADAAADPKLPLPPGLRWPVYIHKENIKQIDRILRAQLVEADFNKIEIRMLPEDSSKIRDPGLLYLPYPYVVPGGRFNEMYGWDSYFIQVGLLRDAELELAKNMVDNFLYEIRHYGRILNANRTYFLSRSQPPFLTEMIIAVFEKSRNKEWLQHTIPAIEEYYRYWSEEPHLTKETGLARYYDLGNGPAVEVLSDELDSEGRTHYDRVREFLRTHEIKDYDVRQFYDKAKDELTPLFFKADRSMRESGFDPSNRFGPFNLDIIHYDPVCLNSLLYVMESQTQEIFRILGRPDQAHRWGSRAARRRAEVNRLMWDAQDGLYYDYDFVARKVRRYPFVTTFYPLWAGIADPAQASAVVANLPLFEQPGGLQTSTNVSGSQWDAPFGWAPMQMIAVSGLRRYGFNEEADRIAVNFLSMVLKEFLAHNTIAEKYDVVQRTSQLGTTLKFGYQSNEIGFGWTNAAFTELYENLPEKAKRDVLNLSGLPLPENQPKRRRSAANQTSIPKSDRCSKTFSRGPSQDLGLAHPL